MSALFKKLSRYTIRCHFCPRFTDTLSINEERAGEYFKDKGWSSFEIKAKDGKESIVPACKVCSTRLRAVEKPAENNNTGGDCFDPNNTGLAMTTDQEKING